ncbi:hypothetical protein [Methylicorpusculum sp.]|uniref:hypothetical protein n=1 Tax=Methylicorpusculum sp. TaxID=2713644 RepID=UPI0027250094|nr:hypothetical protein [Methylicorpusculum sp.]MDO9240075.1 hypothetical protein [Methylicorpusculum sp.]MDP2179798.1 hypothetical protein [Methylicorpusculum sp.]MDP3528485.1 hypothetical protein [Methylicorpusculum sp.]
MKQICAGLLLYLFSVTAFAEYYQYAEFTEIRYEGRNSTFGILLGFSTDPGYPISVLVDEGGAIKATESAYKQLFAQAKWGVPDEYDVTYVLNILGSKGWEVIATQEVKETVFTNRFPATRKEFLMKKKLEKPNY